MLLFSLKALPGSRWLRAMSQASK